MAYTKQTWANGDTVTAAKLNHMEDGIADAGGGGGAISVKVSASGYNSGSHDFCLIFYAIEDDGDYYILNENDPTVYILHGYTIPNTPAIFPLFASESSKIYPFIVGWFADELVVTGGVSSTTTTLHYSWGSTEPGRKITGDGSVQFIA